MLCRKKRATSLAECSELSVSISVNCGSAGEKGIKEENGNKMCLEERDVRSLNGLFRHLSNEAIAVLQVELDAVTVPM